MYCKETLKHDDLRRLVQKFAQNEIVPHIGEWERNTFRDNIFRKMGELGFFAVSYPQEYGGCGLDYFAAMVVTEEIAAVGCPGLAIAFNVQALMATNPILKFGTPEQIKKYFVPAIAGEKIVALGIVEPSAGLNIEDIKTVVKKVENGWVLNGSKTIITNGKLADFIILIAKSVHENLPDAYSIFLVDTKLASYSIKKNFNNGDRLESNITELFFEDTFLSAKALLGTEGNGFKQLIWQLNAECLIQATAIVIGAQRFVDLASAYSKERDQFGKSISRERVIRHYISELQDARTMLYQTAVH